ncbi:MAG: MFS transporter [Steroidobacteraceae bacterium]
MSTATLSHAPEAIRRRVALATIVGTTVEWYDFFIYATAAGLVFADLFFKPAGSRMAAIVSFASVGISFLFRPFGAFLAGHFGDRFGRRAVLVLTLLLMGAATTLIGVLPTYAQAGVLAPALLLLLRILQGISAGGEWGGAILMAVEHAPPARRGLAGSFPQIGVPLGMLLAAGVNALMTGWISPGAEFLAWGWRVPFLLSVVMIVIGYYVRRAVDESPVFLQIAARHQQSRVPIAELFRRHWGLVLLAALVFAGNNSAGYMTTGGFITKYATDPSGPIGLARTPVLLAIAGSAALWLVFTLAGGMLSDRYGRRRVYIFGYACQILAVFPMLALVNTGRIELLFLGLAIFTVGLGVTYGPQAAWYAELFPAPVRFSGVSIAYALGAILGGAFSPMIATALVQSTGGTTAVGWYLVTMSVIALIAVLLLRERRGIDLSIANQAEQEVGATVFERPRGP